MDDKTKLVLFNPITITAIGGLLYWYFFAPKPRKGIEYLGCGCNKK